MTKLRIVLLGIVFAGPVFGHGDDDIHFLSASGTDAGACNNISFPCRTFAYAAGQAGKGGTVRVSEGSYSVDTLEDLFFLTDASATLNGGYSIDFHHRNTTQHPTLVIGVPASLRESLEARGFQVIVDEKWTGTGQGADPELLDGLLSVVRSNSGPATCSGGLASGFECQNVNLLSQLALSGMSSNPSGANDVWGFVDLNTEREYALVGLRNGMVVVDVTDPTRPREVGTIAGTATGWRDIKVLQTWNAPAGRWHAWAYITADAVADRLMVVDLSGLPNSIRFVGSTTPDQRAHNLAMAGVDFSLNIPLPGRDPIAIQAGTNLNQGGFRAFSLANPTNPALLSQGAFGYIHDGTPTVLHNPAQIAACPNATTLCEVFADFNEDTVDLWDITRPDLPLRLASTDYSTARYVHSGSWSENGRYVFAHDEFDERDLGLTTQMYVFDVSDLAAPRQAVTWSGATGAIDHNGYPRGNRYYISNYARGLTVLDITDPTNPAEIGFFDTFPVTNGSSFSGAWGVYPYLPSRNILISDIQGGLFVLEDATRGSPQGQLGFDGRSFAASRGTTAQVPVGRMGGSAGAVSIGWEVIHGTTDDSDVVAARGRLDWPAGDGSFQHIALPIATGEGSFGRLFVRLFDPVGGATLGAYGIASIYLDGGAGASLDFLQAAPEVQAASGRALVVVRRTGSAQGAVSVEYRTEAGTAHAGVDFVASSGTLNWADGDAGARTIEILLLGAGLATGRAFTVLLESVQGATLATSAAAVTIVGTATPPPPLPVAPQPPPQQSGGGGRTGWLFLLALAGFAGWRRRLQV